MKHLMYNKGFEIFSHLYLDKIKQLTEELSQFGNVRLLFLKSNLPLTIMGEVKRGSEIDEDKSNHVIIEIDGKETIEFYRRTNKGFSWGIFHDENLTLSQSEEIEELLTHYNFYTGKKLKEKGIWTGMMISMTPALCLIAVFLNAILLIISFNTGRESFYFYIIYTIGWICLFFYSHILNKRLFN